ncbi:MAG: RidA family protein [Actinomycetota bacterium]|nr:RidA family protein [Actinomycetota bacterium]
MTATQRLAELGISLPSVAAPVAAYVPVVQTGPLVFVSGQLPWVDGALPRTGKVGAEVSAEDAALDARQCALNALAAMDAAVGLDSITRIVKVVGFVASAPGFTGQPAVINGASELFGEVFGDAGVHARSAVGVAELPLGTPVEVEVIAEAGAAGPTIRLAGPSQPGLRA